MTENRQMNKLKKRLTREQVSRLSRKAANWIFRLCFILNPLFFPSGILSFLPCSCGGDYLPPPPRSDNQLEKRKHRITRR